MAIGLVGRKCGMTRVFTDAGDSVPVTVVELLPNRVTQVKTVERDGYRAVQVTYGARRPQLLSKAVAGHYAKANVAPGRALLEFRLRGDDGADLQAGSELKVDRFAAGQRVDVTGVTIGKGFAGVMKRHGFHGLGAGHGVERKHRSPGSVGGCATPGRIFKGVRMAGRMGGERTTTLSLTVHAVDADKNLLLIKGAVPGPTGGLVLVRSAAKRPEPAGQGGAAA